MAIVNATEHFDSAATPSPTVPLATAVRGYDRAAVDEAIARETARVRELESRADRLERELATPPSSGGTPLPRQKVQQALDLMGAGWDEAILITAAAEHAAALDRSHAEHRAAAAMATVEDRCAQAEHAAEDNAQRMVAAAREDAARLRENAAAEQDRAMETAVALIQAAEDRAKQDAVQFAAQMCEAEEQQTTRITARFEAADREVAAAQAELGVAERDAAEISARAQAAREEILIQARAAAEEILYAAGAEVRRRQAENEESLAELGRLLIATGDRLVGVSVDASTNAAPHMTRSIAS